MLRVLEIVEDRLSYTVFRKKNTHSRFLLYLREKCFDLHKIFRVCLWVIRHSIEVKIKYSLLLMDDSQTFYQMFIFYRNQVITQTCKLWRHGQKYVIGSNEYLLFMSIEYLIPHKHTLKILCKSKHFPRRYKKNVNGCFFWTQCTIALPCDGEWEQS